MWVGILPKKTFQMALTIPAIHLQKFHPGTFRLDPSLFTISPCISTTASNVAETHSLSRVCRSAKIVGSECLACDEPFEFNAGNLVRWTTLQGRGISLSPSATPSSPTTYLSLLAVLKSALTLSTTLALLELLLE